MIQSPEVVRYGASAQKLCHYRNATSQLQMIRVTEGNTTLLERVVFPGETWLYEATAETALHIQSQPSGNS